MSPADLLALTKHDAEGALPPGYMRQGGLICYRVKPKRDGDPASEPVHLCGAFEVIGRVVDPHGGQPGTLVEFADRRGITQRHTVADELIFGDARRLQSELADKNLRVEHAGQAGQLLRNLFADIANTTSRYRTAYKQAGWQGKGSFLLPDGTVLGSQDALYALPVSGQNRQSGALADWQQMVTATAPGNSRLILALSISLAGPVLDLTDEPFAGFHLVGVSSSGKSTAAMLAASVWGAPIPTDQVRSWRATDNALESVASEHSDSLLVLDEIAQVDAHLIERCIYMLGNGAGKARANRDGSARESRSWRLVLLSTGEHTAAGAISTTGKRHTTGGVDVRLINIPADAGASMGLFEDTHGMSPAEFAAGIVRNCQAMHGTAGRDWVSNLAMLRQTDEGEALAREVIGKEITLFLDLALKGKVDGQIERVARKFAVASAAGELGIILDVLPLEPGSARGACLRGFHDWLAERGGSNQSKEKLDLIERVRDFCEQHRAQFLDLDADEEHARGYGAQAGFIRDRAFCFLSAAFKDVVAPMGQIAAAKLLLEEGLLDGNKANKYRRKVGPSREARPHCYVIRPTILNDGDDKDDED